MSAHRPGALRLIRICSSLAFAGTLFCAFPLLSQQPVTAPATDSRIAAVVSQLEAVRPFWQVALSPDGRRLAWAESDSDGVVVEVASISDPDRARRLTAGSGAICTEENLAWSPDSRKLAFTSDCLGPQGDIYLATFAPDAASGAGRPRRLTRLHGEVHSLSFSPDGEQIGFLYVDGATRSAGALDAMTPPSGVIGEGGFETQRVASVETGAGAIRQLTPPDLHVYEYDWAPDSRRIAYIAAPPPGENNWWVAQLYTQSLIEGLPHSILNPSLAPAPLKGLQIAVPRWSPDGRQIAFIGGLMSDQGSTGGDLYLIPSSGGPAVEITPKRTTSTASTVTWLQWMGPDSIGVSRILGGESGFSVINSTTGVSSTLPTFRIAATVGDGREDMSLSLSSDGGHLAVIESSFAKPPEVYAGTFLHLDQITHRNDSVKPIWGQAESIDWISGGFHVQGWLLYPANYHPGRSYPLIVSVHGGPSSAVLPRWPGLSYGGVPFSALGYFVLFPNPRGSYGQGEAFTLANRRDFGYGDLRDILAGVDAVSARHPIDQQRIGITGWSYGGFMTMFAVTQTQRFRAAVAGAGISDWQSYYGENSIDQWMIPFFGSSVYDDPAVYAKSSAINFIRNAKTPTLLVVGDRDGECPAPQSFEFWHALRAEHVPARLIVYPDEGHSFRSPEHRRDVLERALAWFEQYMPAQQP